MRYSEPLRHCVEKIPKNEKEQIPYTEVRKASAFETGLVSATKGAFEVESALVSLAFAFGETPSWTSCLAITFTKQLATKKVFKGD